MEIKHREGNCLRYEMKLALPDRSVIIIQRQDGPEECLFVPFVDTAGLPAHDGRPPSMQDLEALVDLLNLLDATRLPSGGGCPFEDKLSREELSRARQLKPLRLLREDT